MTKQKKYHFIYRTTCLITDKFYVGMHSTDNLDDGYLGSGKILGYSRKKYGDENHKTEIIEYFNSRDELKRREAEVVNEDLLANPLSMNLKFGGDGGWEHLNYRNISPEFAGWRKWRRSLVTKEDCSKGGKISGPMNMKLAHVAGKIKYDTFTGKKHSEKTKSKMSESHHGKHEGNKNSQFGVKRIGINMDGKIKKVLPEQLQEYLDAGWKKGFR